MPTQSLGRTVNGTPTLEQALFRLILLASPLLIVYLAAVAVLALLAQDAWRVLVVVFAALGLGALLRWLVDWIVEVPYMSALLVTQRNNLRLEALLKGFYLRPPLLYKRLALVSLRPAEGERVLKRVAMQGGPPLSVRVIYSLRPSVPPYVNVLPRTHLGEAFQARDQRMVGLLLLAHMQPERWQQVSGNAIEEALRAFLSALRVEEIYDPQGAGLDTGELGRRANVHLATTVEPNLGFSVHAYAVEVLDGDVPGTLAWQQRWFQLQQLAALSTNLTPEQAVILSELFDRLAGRGGQGGTDPAILYLLWSQMGYNIPGEMFAPEPPGRPPSPGSARRAGPGRPAA